MYVGQRLALPNGLAYVGRAGAVKLASDDVVELLADFGTKDVSLFGVGTRLRNFLGKHMLPVDDCFSMRGRLQTRKRTLRGLMQLEVFLDTLREIVKRLRLLFHGRSLQSPSDGGNAPGPGQPDQENHGARDHSSALLFFLDHFFDRLFYSLLNCAFHR